MATEKCEIWEDKMKTRRSFLLAGVGSLAAAAAARTTTRAAPALEKVNVVVPANSVFVLSWLGAKDAGIFAKRGIDPHVDVRPFAGFLAGIPSKQSLVGTYAGIGAIDKINEGLDWVILGPGLTVINDVIVRKDAPFKTVADLRGKKFGVFSTGATSFKSVRAALIDGYNFDVAKDTKLQQIAAPALLKLLEQGQVDAMINISSFTVNAEAEPDKFRVLFSPNDYWIKKTGYPITWAGPLVAWRSWINANPTRAKNLAVATREMFRWLEKPANLRTAVKNHGKLAGITTPAAIAEYINWLDKKHMFMTDWHQKAVEAEWEFLEVCKRTGIISKVPPMDKYALFVES
jgi:ABC-type nitrate/sulfonate/bicarbonate transport system substrate-binding protein